MEQKFSEVEHRMLLVNNSQAVNLYQMEVGMIKTKIHKLEEEYKQEDEDMTQTEYDVDEMQVIVENLDNHR